MAKIEWDKQSERFYETGVDRGVLFVAGSTGYGTGVAWNGLISVTESPSGGEPTPLWADNQKYLNLYSAEDFGASLECYTYPTEFEECDGTAGMVDGNDSIPGIKVGMQSRKSFALCYRTLVGNDVNAADAAIDAAAVVAGKGDYKLHFIYGCKATPSEKAYNSTNDSPEATTFSYELSTTPTPVPGMKPTAYITIDTRDLTAAQKANLAALETYVYGDANADAKMPTPEEILSLIKTGSL